MCAGVCVCMCVKLGKCVCGGGGGGGGIQTFRTGRVRAELLSL